jgi:hypothetical protein
MKTIRKLVLLKTAWSERYDGDEVMGNFGYVEEHGPKSGHERYNFRRGKDALYRGYVPPLGRHHSTPNPAYPHGWTVVWVSKKPGTTGVRIVGVYFDASFEPQATTYKVDGAEIDFCVTARDGFLVPAVLRTLSFPSPVRSGACCYLLGAENDSKYRKLSNQLIKEIARLADEVEAEFPTPDVRASFPTNEHIRKVEKAAIDFVWKSFENRGYRIKNLQDAHLGYDLEAVRGRTKLLLEVKGTAGETPYAYVTSNELATALGVSRNDWRMCLVVGALSSPKMSVLDAQSFLDRFTLEPICYRAILKTPKAKA